MDMKPLDYATPEPRKVWPMVASVFLFGLAAAATAAGLMYIAVYELGQWERKFDEWFSWSITVAIGTVAAVIGAILVLAVIAWRTRRGVRVLRGYGAYMLAGALYAGFMFVPAIVDTYWHSGVVHGTNTPYSSGVGDGIGLAIIFFYPPISAFLLVKRIYKIQ